MAKLPRSPIASEVRNNYSPVREARASGNDPVGASLERAGSAAFEIGERMAEAKIAADATEATLRLRSRLDAEARAIENDMEGDPAAFEGRLRERAAAIANEEAGRMSSPALKKAFGLKSQELTETYSLSMRDVTRRRQVEGVKAQTLKIGADYEMLAQDPSKPRELLTQAHEDYTALIDRQVRAGIYTPDVAEQLKISAAATLRTGISTRHLTNMDAMLDAGRYGEAEEYFKANYGEIDPDAREKAESVLEAKTLEHQSVTIADELWDKSGQNYGEFLNLVRADPRIKDPEMLQRVEGRGSVRLNQLEAATAANDKAHLEEGMRLIVDGKPIPSDLLRRASPLVVDRLQSEQRTRQLWAQQMATASAQEKAALRETSRGNYYRLKAQLNDPDMAALGFNGILADPQLNALYENMSPDEQGQFYNDVAGAVTSGGVSTDKALQAYRSVAALAQAYMPTNTVIPQSFTRLAVSGVGTGNPGADKKTEGARMVEGEILRLVTEEIQRTGSPDIPESRAKQIVALAYGNVGGDPMTGRTAFPLDAETAADVAASNARASIIEFRRSNPALWSTTASMVRSKYPDAADAVVLEEARRIMAYRDAERIAGNLRGMFGAGEEE